MDKTDGDVEYDAVADVRAMRLRDIELTEARWARVEASADRPEDPDAGRRLLLALGLDPDEPERSRPRSAPACAANASQGDGGAHQPPA